MSEGLLRHHPPSKPNWIFQMWPIVAFFVVQGAATIWWARGIEADVSALQEKTSKFERVIEEFPDMKATLKNVERMVERLVDNDFNLKRAR